MNGIKGILLMAGKGLRFGKEFPKQFQPLGSKKVYQWTLEKFLDSKLFEEIILVCAPDWISQVQQEIQMYANIRLVEGGNTRQESSYQGLLACGAKTTHVVIHDAVRPFVSNRILKENIAGAKKFGAIDTCIPSADTIVHTPDQKIIGAIPPRKEFMRGQTPQSFAYPLILEAHRKTTRTNASDDCSLVCELGKPVHIVLGEEENLKITSPLDLLLAESLLNSILASS